MKTNIRRQDFPMVFAMIDAADRVKPRRDGRHQYYRFFLLWSAFRTIYQVCAAQAGLQSRLVTEEDGRVRTRANGSLLIPVVDPSGEHDMIRCALRAMPEGTKHALVTHASVKFFKDRTPFWNGQKIEQDAFGQSPNGVLHVRNTTRADYPVWSPIDPPAFEQYQNDPENAGLRDFLAGQVLDLLLTVQENLDQFGRKFDDSNDLAVVEHALSLLLFVVRAFTG